MPLAGGVCKKLQHLHNIRAIRHQQVFPLKRSPREEERIKFSARRGHAALVSLQLVSLQPIMAAIIIIIVSRPIIVFLCRWTLLMILVRLHFSRLEETRPVAVFRSVASPGAVVCE